MLIGGILPPYGKTWFVKMLNGGILPPYSISPIFIANPNYDIIVILKGMGIGKI